MSSTESTTDHLRCVQASNALVGEGPIWDDRSKVLYWVDIKRPAIFRFDPLRGQTGYWPMTTAVGCVAPTRSGALLYADADGIGLLVPDSGEIRRVATLEAEVSGNRFNDGKTDRAGRFWTGSMDDACLQPSGSLYCLDCDLSVKRMATGFICSNGLGWNPDSSIMYVTDSMVRTIWAYPFEAETGRLGQRYELVRLHSDEGFPDGLTVDREGFIWSAIWDGWRIIRIAPDGSVDREINMPVQRPTSCAFGGKDLATLFVTSACMGLDRTALRAGPLAGALFALDVDVPGIPEVPFGGQI